MPRVFRRTIIVSLATALLSVSLGITPALAGAEGSFVNKVNSARASKGKAPVQVYWDLTDDARANSKKMADKGEVFHTANLGAVTTGWKALAENVGVAPSVNLLFDAFMASSAYRSNILGSYNYIGVGVKTDDNGLLWVTMIFMLGDDDLLDPPDDPPPTTTTTKPPSTTTTTKPPSTTTTTKPPSTTTTTKPPSTTTTTTKPPDDEPIAESVPPFDVPEEEFSVLSADWLPPTLLHLIGSTGD